MMGADFNGQRAQNAADASNPSDLVTKAQLDSAIAGQSWKNAVRAATTTNGTLASAFANGSTIDGVALVTGDRILIKNQSTGGENGIYVVNASGAPTRSTDADSTAELHNATVFVREGTTLADTQWTQTATVTTVGTTAQVWVQGGGGTAYVAGDGLDLVSTTFSVDLKAGSGLEIDATELSINIATLKTLLGIKTPYAANVPNGTTTATVTHNLGTTDVSVEVWIVATGETIEPDIQNRQTNSVDLIFPVAPTSGQYRVKVSAN